MDELEFEVDFLAVVILTENPGMSYDAARSQAIADIREDREEAL